VSWKWRLETASSWTLLALSLVGILIGVGALIGAIPIMGAELVLGSLVVALVALRALTENRLFEYGAYVLFLPWLVLALAMVGLI